MTAPAAVRQLLPWCHLCWARHYATPPPQVREGLRRREHCHQCGTVTRAGIYTTPR